MGSYNYGKPEAVAWIRKNFHKDATILDVGACDGKWRRLLPEYPLMDAVEVFRPNAIKILDMYRSVYVGTILDYQYLHYDLVIFGDIIEHLTVKQAQKVLDYTKEHADHVLISVPWKYHQDALYGNKHEIHIQNDLTPELFEDRYPGYKVLIKAADDYYYYTD